MTEQQSQQAATDMPRLRRRDFLRLTAGAALTALAACTPAAPPASTTGESGQAPAAGGRIRLSYTSWGDETRLNSDQENITAFMEQHPDIQVEFIGIADDYSAQVLTMIAGGTPPDVMRINAWDTHAFYARNTALPLTDFFARDGIEPTELFVEPYEQCVYDGTWYGIPRGGTGNQVIYYNIPMFDEAGVPYPADPEWTWEDFLALAQELTRDTDGDGEIDQWGFDFWTWPDGGWQTAVWQNGGEILNEEHSQCLLDQPAAVEAIQWWADLRCVHNAAPTPGQIPEGLGNPFFAGLTAMVQSGAWAINTFRPAEFEWGIQVWPKGPVAHVSYSKPNTVAIYAQTPQQDASWELLKYLFSEECNRHDAEVGLWPPNLKELMNSEWYLESDQKPYDLTPTVPNDVVATRGLPMTTNARQVQEAVMQEMDLVMNCEDTAQAAMGRAAQRVNDLLAELAA